MGLDFGAQGWWRFRCYAECPFRWVHWVHPRMSAAAADSVVDEFFALRRCCYHTESSLKIHEFFLEPEALRINRSFQGGVKTLAHAFCFTDMWCERLLARVRKSVRGEECDVERLCSSGYLCQWVTEHLQLERADPRHVIRLQLQASSVPLRSRPKSHTAIKPASGFVVWMRKQEQQRQ